MKMTRKPLRIGYALILLVSIVIAPLTAIVPKADAADCTTSGETHFGRTLGCGYFNNKQLNGMQSITSVIPGGMHVNSVDEFINRIQSSLSGGGNAHTGARFIIKTMTGGEDVNELRRRVQRYANQGKINWNQRRSNDWSTYYQEGGLDDIAWSKQGVTRDYDAISFNGEYYIDRECGNPRENMNELKKTIEWHARIEGGGSSPTTIVEPNIGNVNLWFRVRNDGPDETGADGYSDLWCRYSESWQYGYRGENGSPSTGGNGYGCPGHLGGGRTQDITISVGVGAGDLNKTICRTFAIGNKDFNSDNDGSPHGEHAIERCFYVVAKPYMKFFTGDVSTGGLQESGSGVCGATFNAGVTSWNKGSGSGYAGSGVQYALFAYAAVSDFASAQYVNAAAVPKGLTFANNSGEYGGGFGAANCIADYFRRKPASAVNVTNASDSVNGMHNNSYFKSGDLTLTGGNINPNDKVTAYVDGNLYITGNIVYQGRWDLNTMPLFQVVVRGNIYIDNDVTRLDGVYVAQRNPGADGLLPSGDDSGGIIYTCTTSAAPMNADGGLYSPCRNKLTVNGAFVAYSVQLLRTGGGLYLSGPTETSNSSGGGNSAAEVFNYSPAVWMMQQPADTNARVDSYDSISSLPPVL